MADEKENVSTRPTDPTAATVVPAGKTRMVKLDSTFCPEGSGAVVAGKSYVVGAGSMLTVPDSVSDEALRADLGALVTLPVKA
jgi:hypothetical protein